ncbi:hypothetical protein Y032_0010g971 [Ancylostoma ceylanicum]|uniref:Methyltransferase type 11 domain-containing protein n=1 Tax=Ancylostoma ceylanicum TaxID=53326 RepID=A0A016VH92_9BILA|nr:hypothetical protein Y032_0010g971 [Ancylostoma ceylanicum]
MATLGSVSTAISPQVGRSFLCSKCHCDCLAAKHTENDLEAAPTETLTFEMYDNGFRTIHSIDNNSSVIEEQRLRNKQRPELVFLEDDATSMSSGDESFSVVIDKGTLDALLPPDATVQQLESVRNMFAEVDRVLKIGGRYQIITLAQQHIVKFWIEYFSKTHKASKCNEYSNGEKFRYLQSVLVIFYFFQLRYFGALIACFSPIELCRSSCDRVERFHDQNELESAIIAEQELSQFVHLCSRKLDSEASISIESSLQQGPRYRFFIVDDAKAKAIRSYAVFIVPLGREGEWIFSTEKGRRTLLEQAKKDRLAVVTLSRTQSYSSLKDVQDELGPFASRFDPRENGGLIDFLSCGSVDVRVTQASGESAINGKWTVEDVVVDEQEYRRLVFLSSSNIVQSEAPLKTVKGKKTVNLEVLSCDHHSLMLSGLSLLPQNPFGDPSKTHIKLAVLGLGGGILASFLLRHFNKAVIDAIELDPDVVKVATQWFALPSRDSRMNVQVKDALDYLEEAPQKGDREKLDMLFVDLAGAVHESGLSCPPAVFLTDPVLRNMKNSLGANGVVALNLVTRDADVAERARRSISAHFPALFHIHSEEDVNENFGPLLSPTVVLMAWKVGTKPLLSPCMVISSPVNSLNELNSNNCTTWQLTM